MHANNIFMLMKLHSNTKSRKKKKNLLFELHSRQQIYQTTVVCKIFKTTKTKQLCCLWVIPNNINKQILLSVSHLRQHIYEKVVVSGKIKQQKQNDYLVYDLLHTIDISKNRCLKYKSNNINKIILSSMIH